MNISVLSQRIRLCSSRMDSWASVAATVNESKGLIKDMLVYYRDVSYHLKSTSRSASSSCRIKKKGNSLLCKMSNIIRHSATALPGLYALVMVVSCFLSATTDKGRHLLWCWPAGLYRKHPSHEPHITAALENRCTSISMTCICFSWHENITREKIL